MVIFAVVASMSTQPAAAPPTTALQVTAPSCCEVMKLAPVTVMVLLTYPASGVVLVTLGVANTTNPVFKA